MNAGKRMHVVFGKGAGEEELLLLSRKADQSFRCHTSLSFDGVTEPSRFDEPAMPSTINGTITFEHTRIQAFFDQTPAKADFSAGRSIWHCTMDLLLIFLL